MFYIGQEVIAIKNDFTPQGRGVSKGVSYVVKDIQSTCKCGTCIDVGIQDVYESALGKIGNCTICGEGSIVDNVVWFTIDVFVPVNYSTAKQVTFEKIVEDIPVFSN